MMVQRARIWRSAPAPVFHISRLRHPIKRLPASTVSSSGTYLGASLVLRCYSRNTDTHVYRLIRQFRGNSSLAGPVDADRLIFEVDVLSSVENCMTIRGCEVQKGPIPSSEHHWLFRILSKTQLFVGSLNQST
jgi:hypothetical protein